MLITCPACQASYEIPDHLLVNTPVRLRCAQCGAEWAWMGAKALPAEKFELPDLFSAGPLPHAVGVPPDNQAIRPELPERPELAIMPGMPLTPELPLTAELPVALEPAREPIGSPVFHPSSEPFLPPPAIEAPRRDSMIEIPRMPVSQLPPDQASLDQASLDQASPDIGQNAAKESALSREAMFRRVIETDRQRSLAPLARSRRPQLVAIVALIVLIALFIGVHFVMVNGVTAGPAG